ncbi:MAG: hypothetical protein JWQ40_5083 [Segetibacter sp.]|nr:hypothetical protein [Segetibacter sp.]
MHPRIKELYELIKIVEKAKVLTFEVLHFLKENGATRTEAAIVLHLCFNIEAKQADDFVIKSQVWEPEDPDDVFYQTLKYLYYNPEDSNYEADDNRVQVSI